MQYNRKADGSLEPLPAKVIDTGMGFERLCMALQGKTSNYDTDVFQPIIRAIGQLCGKKYGEDRQADIAMRVIADHVRTIAFSITDGQLPSNAKAGYVIRRILRRAVRYGYTFLGQYQAFIYTLIPTLIDTMGDAYPELISQKILIEKVIKEEEESFLRTLATGMKLLDKVMADTKEAGMDCINGKDAFTLYDTYGFPLDLTELILKENGLSVDTKEFDAQMQQQKERARNAAAIETGDWVVVKEGEPRFIGYDFTECDAEILRYRKIKQKNKELYQIVLDQTPFYAESGGQVGDTGTLTGEGETIKIINTKKENNLSIHISEKLPKDITATLRAVINKEARLATACNHSATHLLHEALRTVLGTHVEQKGSLVTPDSLRFDFSHSQAMTTEQIARVEDLVNEQILANTATKAEVLPLEEARKTGATMLFGEKYGDIVRVETIGNSVELCGGTHVVRTGDIGSFKILGEAGVAAGIRRIEAVTGMNALAEAQKNAALLGQAAFRFNVKACDLPSKIDDMMANVKALEKQLEQLKSQMASRMGDTLLEKAIEVKGIKVLAARMDGADAKALRETMDKVKDKLGTAVAVLAAVSAEGRVQLAAGVSRDLTDRVKAGELVNSVAQKLGGKGGGKPDMAMAGAQSAEGLDAALADVQAWVEAKL